MKKFYFYSLLALLIFGTSACQEISPEILTNPLINISIEETGANSIKVRFTPSEQAVSFEYAIGKEEHLILFENGEIEKSTGDKEVVVEFSDLNPNEVYTIFAQAYDADNSSGPVAIRKIATSSKIANGELQWVTKAGASIHLTISYDYSSVIFALGKPGEKHLFENGAMSTRKLDNIEEYYAAYFDLEENTDYVFYYQAVEREGEGKVMSDILEVPFKTLAAGEGPEVDLEFVEMNVYKSTFRYTPNEYCKRYAVMTSVLDTHHNMLEDALTWRGNILGLLDSWTDINLPYIFPIAIAAVDAMAVNPSMVPEVKYEQYIILYNDDYVPVGVQKHLYTGPSIDPSAQEATMEIEISYDYVTHNTVPYLLTPNEHALGFFWGVVDADWYDQVKESPSYHEFYLHERLLAERPIENSLANNGGKWREGNSYFYYTDKDPDFKPNTRYYLVAFAVNKNGIYENSGCGEMAMEEFWTKEAPTE